MTTLHPRAALAKLVNAVVAALPTQYKSIFTPGNVSNRVLGLAWPSVLEQSLVTVVGLVDTYIVGHLGAEAIAGVGLGGQVLNLSAALFGALGVGATAVVARAIGARQRGEAEAVAGQAIVVAAVIGAFASLIVYSFDAPIIAAFGAAPGVIVQGATWLRVAGPSFIFMGVLLVANAILRGAGDTRTPLVAMIVVNIVNVVTAWILTRMLGWGVLGTGIGFALGQISGCLIALAALFGASRQLRLNIRSLQPDLTLVKRILNIGLPAGMEQIILQIALAYSAVLISGFGTAAYAAHQIAMRIASLSFLPGWGFSVATTTLVGQGLGANKPESARESTHAALRFAVIVMTSLGLLLFVFARPIIGLFTTDAEVIRQGVLAIRIGALAQPLMAQSFIFGGALRGAGDTRATMVITMLCVWALRIVVTYFVGNILGLGIIGAWVAIGVDFATRGTLFAWRFRTGKWAAVRV